MWKRSESFPIKNVQTSYTKIKQNPYSRTFRKYLLKKTCPDCHSMQYLWGVNWFIFCQEKKSRAGTSSISKSGLSGSFPRIMFLEEFKKPKPEPLPLGFVFIFIWSLFLIFPGWNDDDIVKRISLSSRILVWFIKKRNRYMDSQKPVWIFSIWWLFKIPH